MMGRPGMSRVAVIGIGAMGSRIASRLLSQGHEVPTARPSTASSTSTRRCGQGLRTTSWTTPTTRSSRSVCSPPRPGARRCAFLSSDRVERPVAMLREGERLDTDGWGRAVRRDRSGLFTRTSDGPPLRGRHGSATSTDGGIAWSSRPRPDGLADEED